MKRFLHSVLTWTFVYFFLASIFVYLVSSRPFRRYDEPPPTLTWGSAESIRLTTDDGEDLGAWFIDRPGEIKDAPAVVLLHGVGANRSQPLPMAEEFARRGCPVLLISQRSHGDSTGDKNDFGYSGRGDVAAAVDYLRERLPGRKIVVWGTSMGAAAACFACEGLGDKVSGYILECPFQNLRIATRNRVQLVFPAGVEYAVYQSLNLIAPVFLGDIDRIAPETAAAKIAPGVPMLILAGEHDRLATPQESMAIAQSAGPCARCCVIPNGQHSNLIFTNPDALRREYDRFFAELK